MLTITVAQDGSGDFASIAEAVLAVPYEEEALVQVGPGLYREKLICEKRCITLRGAGADKTKLVWGDGGRLPHPDGRPTHTFRSYTAFFSGGTLCVEDMTIENDAGPGAQAGQAVAAYVDSARAVFRRVKLLGNQDTLFCAPLPEKEREKDGFLGPRGLAPRRPTAQYYTECEIAGDIDFIFGGGDAHPPHRGQPHPPQLCHRPVGQSRRAGLRVLGLRFRLRLPGGQRLSGPSVASRGEDGGAGLPPRCPHRPGRLHRVERPHGHRSRHLRRGRQRRPGRGRASGVGACPLRAGGGGAAGPRPRPLPPGMTEDVTDEKTA